MDCGGLDGSGLDRSGLDDNGLDDSGLDCGRLDCGGLDGSGLDCVSKDWVAGFGENKDCKLRIEASARTSRGTRRTLSTARTAIATGFCSSSA